MVMQATRANGFFDAAPPAAAASADVRHVFRTRVLPLFGDADGELSRTVAASLDRLLFYCRIGGLEPTARRGGRIVDLGAGLGALAPLLAALGARAAVVDDLGGGGSVDRDDVAGARAVLAGFRLAFGLEAFEQDLLTTPLPFPDGSVDAVTSFHCFEHLHHSPRRLMEEVRRILRPGGRFVVGTPNAVNLRKRVAVLFGRTNLGTLQEWYWEGPVFRGHVREPVVEDLVRLCEWSALRVERVVGRNFLARRSRSYARLPRALRPLVDPLLDRVLPRWPRLCTDIHVVAAKERQS
jgi:SAM-dependent methyltransferase